MAKGSGTSVRCLVAGSAEMIRIDDIWLATQPLVMRSRPYKALSRVIQAFRSASPHCTDLFAINERLPHD